MELASPLYSYFLIFGEVGNLQMELARPAVFLFSYSFFLILIFFFVFLFSYFELFKFLKCLFWFGVSPIALEGGATPFLPTLCSHDVLFRDSVGCVR